MKTSHRPLRIGWFVAGSVALLASLNAGPSVPAGDTIRVWKVGSPHEGDTPRPNLPAAVVQDYQKHGYALVVETFPAMGFSSVFSEALTRNAAPDLLVIDNMGIIDGITTRLGRFDGIAQNPTVRRDLIHVTAAFDELLGPRRGWTYLFSASPNHGAARTLALRAPRCATRTALTADRELSEMATMLGAAYLERRDSDLLPHTDPERLTTAGSGPETTVVGTVSTCALVGNDQLVFASVKASYEAETKIGHAAVLIVLRRTTDRWQLLIAARDPVSNERFLQDVQILSSLLNRNGQPGTIPLPATLLAPKNGDFPPAPPGERFGTFAWRSSSSADVVAEIGEFAYKNDARLFLNRPSVPESLAGVSAGRLWTTSSPWTWRVWSIARSGAVTFSEARTFVH